MALNFPNSPTNGQLYTDSASGNRWVWDSGNTCWVSTSTFTQTITVASSAPGSPVTGQLWWNKDYGRLLVYYTDDNTSQWVDASPSDYTSQLAYGVANAAFAKANNALANTSGTFAGTLTTTSNVIVGTSTSNVSLSTSSISVNSINLTFPGCGRLNYTDTNTVTYVPYNGNVIKIAGSLYTIPSAGIAGTRTNCYINGTAGQTLSANTTYYVYAFNNSGTPTLDFSTTGHSTDTSTHNSGVECKSGDNSRTLVGMVYPYSNAFIDDNRRLVLSWFNRQQKVIYVNGGGNFSTTSVSMTLVTPANFGTYVPIMLNWADMPTNMTYACQTGTSGSYSLNAIFYDNSTSNGFGPGTYIYTSSFNVPCFLGGTFQLSEGFHSYWLGIGASSGSGTVINYNGNWLGHTWG